MALNTFRVFMLTTSIAPRNRETFRAPGEGALTWWSGKEDSGYRSDGQ